MGSGKAPSNFRDTRVWGDVKNAEWKFPQVDCQRGGNGIAGAADYKHGARLFVSMDYFVLIFYDSGFGMGVY